MRAGGLPLRLRAGPSLDQEVLDRLGTTKTRLAARSYLDENDIGLSYTQTFLVPNKIDLAACCWLFSTVR